MKKTVKNFIKKYEKNYYRITGFNSFLRAVAAVMFALLGGIIGALICGGIGFFAGIWSGPGAVLTALTGVLFGIKSGAAIGLFVASGLVGIGSAALGDYLFFRPTILATDCDQLMKVLPAVMPSKAVA